VTTGEVAVNNGATLEVAESGTVKAGSLTLADGATLKFNVTDKTTAPQLAVSGTTTASGVVNVRMTGPRPKNGRYALTTGGGFDAEGVTVNVSGCPEGEKVRVNASGNLELTACYGFMVIVK
jgi:hypothetical protein